MECTYSGKKIKIPLDMTEYVDEVFETVMKEVIYLMLEVAPPLRPSATDLIGHVEVAFASELESSDSESISEPENVTSTSRRRASAGTSEILRFWGI